MKLQALNPLRPLALAGAIVALAGCSATGSHAMMPPAQQDSTANVARVAAAGTRAKTIYMSGYDAESARGNGELATYSAAANGDIAPLRTIKGASANLLTPEGVAVAANGAIWTCDFDLNTISEFSATAHGNVAPIATLAGSNVPIHDCADVTLSAGGKIYASSYDGQNGNVPAVAGWNSGASGNVAPPALYAGTHTGFVRPSGVALDSKGHLYVSDAGTNWIDVFGGTDGNVAPEHSIAGSLTLLTTPYGIAVDPNNNTLFVADEASNTIAQFAYGAHGNVAPLTAIRGAKTKIDNPYGIAVDDAGYIYVGNCPQNVAKEPATASIEVFAPKSNGNVSPVQTITGKQTDLSCVSSLTVR
jgi:DNA-binding beta-propeller fold protein YncE